MMRKSGKIKQSLRAVVLISFRERAMIASKKNQFYPTEVSAMKLRRFVVAALAAVMLLGLAGCGSLFRAIESELGRKHLQLPLFDIRRSIAEKG